MLEVLGKVWVLLGRRMAQSNAEDLMKTYAKRDNSEMRTFREEPENVSEEKY